VKLTKKTNQKKKNKTQLRPSLSEYFVFDDLAYHALTTDDKRNDYYKSVFNTYLKDKIVLDIGAGPEAIQSRFCIEAGAKKVYAVEIQKNVYEKAKKRVKELGLEDKIILVHGDITQVQLPEKVDYCVSEIVGPIGGSEGSAKLINSSRRLLKSPENMIPKRSLTKIAGAYLPDEYHKFTFDQAGKHYVDMIFDEVGYKFDLRLCVEDFPLENVLTNTQPFEDLDYTNTMELEGDHTIKLEFTKDSILTGFIVWLNLFIDDDQVIDTLSERYSWLPVYLPVFYNETKVEQGDYIEAVITRKLSDNDLNPDFIITGTLFRKNNASIPFEYISSNHEKRYRHSPFYESLFDNDKLQVATDTITPKSIITYLKEQLPEFMVPNLWIELDEWPLTINDKLDKKALPNPTFKTTESYVAPITDMEKSLCSIWSSVLGIEKIGVTDDLFRIGGNSILAMQLTHKINEEHSLMVKVSDIFETPTIQLLLEKFTLESIDTSDNQEWEMEF